MRPPARCAAGDQKTWAKAIPLAQAIEIASLFASAPSSALAYVIGSLAGLSVFGIGSANAQAPVKQKLKIMMRGGWGTDDPTRAAFVFAHALALSDAGHDVQVFLTGEATYLMRKSTVEAVKPIGWPPLTELRDKAVASGLRVFS